MSKSDGGEGEDEDGDEDKDEVEDGELSASIYKWVDSQIFWSICPSQRSKQKEENKYT